MKLKIGQSILFFCLLTNRQVFSTALYENHKEYNSSSPCVCQKTEELIKDNKLVIFLIAIITVENLLIYRLLSDKIYTK